MERRKKLRMLGTVIEAYAKYYTLLGDIKAHLIKDENTLLPELKEDLRSRIRRDHR